MHPLFAFAEMAYIEAQNLIPLLKDYTNSRDLLSRMVKRGDLIRLKNGFYIISEKIKKQPVPYEQIANLLYGPSYISFEWALSYYGMIPEGVYIVTSASTTRSKSFKTPVGVFDYTYLNHSRYAIGINQGENSTGRFLIATPEKALADLVYKKCKKLPPKELIIDLIEGRRIDKDHLKNLNKQHLQDIATSYSSQAVTNLVHTVGLL